MPVPLPQRPRSKAVPAEKSIDWLTLWALSMGLASLCIGAIAFFSAGDGAGASLVLAGGAALIALALFGSQPSGPKRY